MAQLLIVCGKGTVGIIGKVRPYVSSQKLSKELRVSIRPLEKSLLRGRPSEGGIGFCSASHLLVKSQSFTMNSEETFGRLPVLSLAAHAFPKNA